jgi:chromosome partitioning protein
VAPESPGFPESGGGSPETGAQPDGAGQAGAPEAGRGSDPAQVIAVSNQKGGVAKTSTCLNLGMSLALLNKKVLLIDFDTQSNLTLSLGYRDTPSFYDVFHPDGDGTPTVVFKTRYPNLWVLPSNENLARLERKTLDTVHSEHILDDWLAPIKRQYDHILIDTPPAAGFFTLNALYAAGLAVIPSVCEYLSANGANQILKVIRRLKSGPRPELQYRVLVTMYDSTDPSAQVVYAKLTDNFRDRSFKTVISYDTRMKESQIMKLPAIVYDKTCRCGGDYMQLARELLNGGHVAGRLKETDASQCAEEVAL